MSSGNEIDVPGPGTELGSNDYFIAERVFIRERASKIYQEQLQCQIHEEALLYDELRRYCKRLESDLLDGDRKQLHMETQLRHASEDRRTLLHNLGLEQAKNQDLESRLAGVYPMVQSLLLRLQSCDHSDALKSQIQQQQEQISSLQAILQTKEETLRILGQAFCPGEAMDTFTDCSDCEQSFGAWGDEMLLSNQN
ncbi:hypothetical protein N7449_011223 [Penicillium cf. viridicatum]|uniref:Uncharacterized protein n=1 Tax=Penicillium cf. viridicatum TaxID=2972119 RepID=A0A9W9M2P2_9EURO|nr:hypothetical protein N7449_011223 [Penicillium cf. viridicatum]